MSTPVVYIISDDDDDEDDDEVIITGVRTIQKVSHTDDSIPLPADHQPVSRIIHDNGFIIEMDSTFQYMPSGTHTINGERDHHFFRVRRMFEDDSGAYYLEGWNMRPSTYASDGYLNEIGNEVAIILEVQYERDDIPLINCLTTMPLPEVLWHRKIVFTNTMPTTTETASLSSLASEDFESSDCVLFCRWIWILKRAGDHRSIERVAKHLPSSFCSSNAVEDVRRFTARRSGSGAQRTHRTWRAQPSTTSPRSRHDNEGVRHQRRYTYGDVGVGGGGSLYGAFNAGLNIKFGIDMNVDCLETLRAQPEFARMSFIQADVREWAVAVDDVSWHVDILHISFPCQGFSGLNRGGKNDDINRSTGYCLTQLVVKCQPRVVTIEQVLGVAHDKHIDFFKSYFLQLTSMGYQVRAQEINMAKYGHCHARKRWIIIAVRPGTELINMPPPTHGPQLRPFTTLQDRLDTLVGARIPEHMQYAPTLHTPATPYNADEPMTRMLTCSANDSDTHPSGRRRFTLAERAVIQSFDTRKQWVGKPAAIIKQLGNVVPPVFAEALFKHVSDSLHDIDTIDLSLLRRGRV